MERILSFSNLDPNIVIERDGKLYRRIIRATQGRWEGLADFVRSESFQNLMYFGWIPQHDINHPIKDGTSLLYEVERVRHFNYHPWWTQSQYAEALRLIALIQEYLETSCPPWLLIDCHAGNLTYKHSKPVYIDMGSFSKTLTQGAWEHYKNAWTPLGMDAVNTWKEAQTVLGHYQPVYHSTEWDHYAQPEPPKLRSDIKPWAADQETLLAWAGVDGVDLLDIGCNRGHLSRLFAIQGFEVVAVDISPSCVDTCWRTARMLELPITSLCLDILKETQNLEALACDVVVASSVTHHFFRQDFNWRLQECLFRRLTKRVLLIEYILPDDPNIQPWQFPPEYGPDYFYNAFSAWKITHQAKPEMPTRLWLRMIPPNLYRKKYDTQSQQTR